MTTTVDWAGYNANASGRPARRVVSRAMAAARIPASRKVVLDIGAGGGADALHFARHGWTVHAYDTDDTLAARLVENERMPGQVIFHHEDAGQVQQFPDAGIIYSSNALPMLGPEGFARTWPLLVDALPRGGVAAVDLFGTHDTWHEREDIVTLSSEEIDQLFRGFAVLDREVRDEAGRSWNGKKHWHVITTLARRL